jgi:hypothetical protein
MVGLHWFRAGVSQCCCCSSLPSSPLRIGAQRNGGSDPTLDWPQFGYDAASPSASPARTGIDAANVASLSRRQASLGGTADASAIYLHSVKIAGSFHDTFFVTTSYGATVAIDADSGAALWRSTPASYSSLLGTAQITNCTPAADPNREFIYAAAPDGTVQKLGSRRRSAGERGYANLDPIDSRHRMLLSIPTGLTEDHLARRSSSHVKSVRKYLTVDPIL